MAEHHYRDWFRFLTSNLPGRRPAEWFRFVSGALPKDAFHVIRFSGTEGLNELFSFTIELVSRNAAIDGEQLMSVEAEFVILREKGTPAVFRGFPSRLEQGGHFGEWTYYTVELRPAFWKLTKVTGNAIFLNKTAQEAAAELLTSQPFFQFGHEFRLMRRYPVQEFAMQYGESLYDYILFRMEEQGAYFYFAPDGDKVIFADTPLSHNEPVARLTYAPGSGMEFNHRDEVLHSFTLTQTPLPRQVVLRCYDWQDPKRVIVGMAEVSPHGLGDVYLAGENAESENEANRLAKIRSEELVCRSRVFTGMGTAPTLRPGVRFKLEGHYSETFNKDYLVTEITHEGAQEAFVTLGLGIPLESSPNHLFYRNSFSCIRTNVPYRPARTAPRAKISGVLRAFVDGAQNKRPEMDELGRYKLIFPFDLSGRKGGNASCWIRMAGPQSGPDSGMAFPLLPGTEVVVSFIDGNPDRPVITGSLPNGESGAIAGQGNPNASGIRSVGGAQITFDDTDQNQSVTVATAAGAGVKADDSMLGNLVMKAGIGCQSFALGASELVTATKAVSSGYRISHTAGSNVVNLLQSLVNGTCSGIDTAADKLSAKASRAGVTAVAGAVGDVAAAAQPILVVILEIINKLKNRPMGPYYGASLSASKKLAASVLQTEPNKSEIVAWALNALSIEARSLAVAGGGTAALVGDIAKHDQVIDNKEQQDAIKAKEEEIANINKAILKVEQEIADLEKTDATDTEKQKEEKQKQKEEKQKEAQTLYAKKVYAEKELDALKIQLSKMPDNPEWAYWTNTVQKAARNMLITPITSLLPIVTSALALALWKNRLASTGGVSISSDDNNVNIRAAEPVSLHSEGGILLDTKLGLDEAAKWGIKTMAGVSQDLCPLGENNHKWHFKLREQYKDKPGNNYVVVDTDTLGLFAKMIRANATTDFVSVAPTHTLKSGDKDDPNAKLEMQDDGGGSIAATVSDDGKIILSRGPATDNKKPHLELSADGCLLVNGQHVKLTLTDSEATLTAEGGSLALRKNEAEVKGKNSTITCNGNGIDLDPAGGKVTFGAFTWDKNGKIGYGGGVLKVTGGTIKIG